MHYSTTEQEAGECEWGILAKGERMGQDQGMKGQNERGYRVASGLVTKQEEAPNR